MQSLRSERVIRLHGVPEEGLLLAMVQKNPQSRDDIYALLNELQAILDAGRSLVKRNRQFLDEEEKALATMEANL